MPKADQLVCVVPINSDQLGILSGFQVLLLESSEKKAFLSSDGKDMKTANGNGMQVILLKEFEEITIRNLSRQEKMFFPLDVLKRDIGNIFLTATILADYNDDSYRKLAIF